MHFLSLLSIKQKGGDGDGDEDRHFLESRKNYNYFHRDSLLHTNSSVQKAIKHKNAAKAN